MPQEEPDPDLAELSSEDERDRLSPSPLEWKFSQVFGERVAGEEVQEVDIISAIEFDKSGDHLATGDRGGRVVLFERTDSRNLDSRMNMERQDYSTSRHPEFCYKTEFQSHEPEFDYLKSLEIEEKINKIRWHQTSNGSLFLLSTNDKTIKYWKLCDLYENDSILDKFESCLSGDGLRVATGSYSNPFRVFGCFPSSNEAATLEATKNPLRRVVQNPTRPSRSLSSLT